MKCEEASRDLIGYLDRRANSAERRAVEDHLASCAACRAYAEQLRGLWSVLDDVPAVEPSIGFDARVRARVAQEPQPRWFLWLIPQPRLAFSLALLLVLSVWVIKLPRQSSGLGPVASSSENEQFQEISDLGVLENYDVLTKVDALSELTPTNVDLPVQKLQDKATEND
jgi:predicted anti-sigma-YlaC factor YlaD